MTNYEQPNLTFAKTEEVNRYLFRLVGQLNNRDIQLEKELDTLRAEIAELRKEKK